MQLPTVRAFVAVCDHGSYQAAARALHLTQPAISKRLRVLEAQLGRRLFDRIGRRVLLTEAGRQFLPHARRLLMAADDAQRALDDLGKGVRGQLRLALSHHVGLHRMPPVLRRYAASYPQVELEISFMGSEDACRAVRHGQLELAVITLPDCADADLEQCEIWHDPLHVVVARDHPLAHESRVTPASLASHPALLPQPDTVTYGVVAAALAGHGLHPQLRHGSNYLETLKMLTSIGLGWSALPASLVDGDLAVLTLPELSMTRSLGSVRHPGRHLSHAAEALLALLGSASEHELAP